MSTAPVSFRLLSARALFLIVLHIGVKKDSRNKGMICDAVYRNGEYELQEQSFMASVKTVYGKLLHIFKSHFDFIFPVLIVYFCKYFRKKIKQTIAAIKRGENCVNGIQFVSSPVLHLYKYTRVLFVDLGLEMRVGL